MSFNDSWSINDSAYYGTGSKNIETIFERLVSDAASLISDQDLLLAAQEVLDTDLNTIHEDHFSAMTDAVNELSYRYRDLVANESFDECDDAFSCDHHNCDCWVQTMHSALILFVAKLTTRVDKFLCERSGAMHGHHAAMAQGAL